MTTTENVSSVRRRDVVRSLMVNEDKQVLLIKEYFGIVKDPDHLEIDGPIWVLPGGGVEPGETHEETAVRELREETGISIQKPERWIWSREKLLTINGTPLIMDERYYLVHVPSNTVTSRLNLSESDQQTVLEHRWWTLDELQTSHDVVAPAGLSIFVEPLLAGDIPDRPRALPAR